MALEASHLRFVIFSFFVCVLVHKHIGRYYPNCYAVRLIERGADGEISYSSYYSQRDKTPPEIWLSMLNYDVRGLDVLCSQENVRCTYGF